MEDYQKRMLDEHSDLKDRLAKLNAALAKDGFREKVGDYQFKLMKEQALGMQKILYCFDCSFERYGFVK